MRIEFSESQRAECLWRYMSVGRFMWMLHEKALWFSRADRVGDPWEACPSEAQIEADVATVQADIAKRTARMIM